MTKRPPILASMLCASLLVADGRVAGQDLERAPHVELDVRTLQTEFEAESPELTAKLARPLSMQDCLDIALERNLLLEVARDGRDAARVRADGAIGQFLPELAVVGRRTRVESNGLRVEADDATAGIIQRLPIGTIVEAGVRLSNTAGDPDPTEGSPSLIVTQPLLRGGGWTTGTASLKDTRLAAAAQDADLRAQILLLEFVVKSTYLDVLRRRQLIDVNERGVARDEQLLAFSQAKLEAQLATQRDVLSAEIILAQDRSRLVNAQAQYRQGLDNLSNVLGLRVARDMEIESIELGGAEIPTDEALWVETALRDNPGLVRARLQAERTDLSRRVAGNTRLPQLDVSLGYNQRRAPFSANPFERTWDAAVAASWPFLNKELGAAHEAANLAYEQSKRLVLDAERNVTLSVRDVVRNLLRSQERIAILEKNMQGAQAKVEFATVNFQLGRASNLDITDAQRDLLDAETEHVNEMVIYRVELARLEQLLGGPIPGSEDGSNRSR